MIAGNINSKSGVKGNVNVGVVEIPPTLQEKTINPTSEEQIIKPDENYNGLSKVIVNAISDEYVKVNGTLDINSNGEYDVKNYEKANVNVGGASKGIIINECDSTGYAIDVSVVGMTTLPRYYLSNYNQYYPNFLVKNLKKVNLSSELTRIEDSAFYKTSSIEIIEFSKELTSIGSSACCECYNLSSIELPIGVTRINSHSFYACKTNMIAVTCLGDIKQIDADAFNSCLKLEKFILPNITSVPTLSNTNAFGNTPIAKGTGYFYIPDSLVTQMQSSSNWSTYASQIKGVSEL